ncbi:MAG: glycoside hydrolase, partial [Gammaproteobacteria bacterium]
MSDNPTSTTPLNVVLYWHMHQPEYRDLRNGEYHQPWTYLHTIKDYVDMAAHLENNTQARAVVNFAPVLLEQIDDYGQQLQDYLHHGKALRDPLLAALAGPVMPSDREAQLRIIKACLRANKARLVDRFEVFKNLSKMARAALKNPETLNYYSEQFFADLLVWYHLAWTAENVRLTEPRIQAITSRAKNFTLHDRHSLIEIIADLVVGVIERYKKLADAGRIELSMTPYAHPILPLLLDLKSARQAMPEAVLPNASTYPGGEARSHWHMQKGLEVFRKYFGREPQGCWPSEGSISSDTIELISKAGIHWLASGDTVLKNSLLKSGIQPDECMHEVYQYRDAPVACFFRDDMINIKKTKTRGGKKIAE